ncbi:MAG TPA: hypothetical protein VEQ17_05880 [Steroidobacteraceae bacterium]|nr:hypothetical protein [Steroidobacteraceae bacterium]
MIIRYGRIDHPSIGVPDETRHLNTGTDTVVAMMLSEKDLEGIIKSRKGRTTDAVVIMGPVARINPQKVMRWALSGWEQYLLKQPADANPVLNDATHYRSTPSGALLLPDGGGKPSDG